jgi:hypothetical protein
MKAESAKNAKKKISRKADFLLRPVRPHYGGQVAPSPVRQPPTRVNRSGLGTPDREGALPVRRSLWSYGRLLLRSAKLDPRAPRRRARSQSCIFALD